MSFRVRERLRQIAGFHDTPHRIALAVALGIFTALTPTIGLHTITALSLAWLFRVSKAITLMATFVNNPWTIAPIYTGCLLVGLALTGRPFGLPRMEWNGLTAWAALDVLSAYLAPFVLGTLLVGLLGAVAAYFFTRWAVARHRAG
ncbi:MAG: DUF2062 domain-containing protein [Nitrospirae bacterium]|nr:DUF2062 domain-containing protein [Nitrospirota bacterium]MBI3392675.1 DUF2062 domain-containing protein [Nitrospirota bacterium]